MNKLIWILLSVAVVAVVIIAVYFVFPQQGGPSEVVSTTPPAPSPAPTVTVSDNPDVVITDIINSAGQESLTPEEADPTLVADNSQTIDSFDQSSNPNQF